MKKFIPILLVALLFAACDKVEGPYSQKPTDSNDTGAVRKILLEDYTGQKCGNCPRAAEAVQAIKDIYGDKIVSMGVHVGYFATPNPSTSDRFTYDFRTEAGDYWDGEFHNGDLGLPNGMVNRKEFNGNVVQSYTNWATAVSQIINAAPDAKIKITPTYNSSNRQVTASVKTDILNGLSGDYRLCVYITEDSIVGWQKDYSINPNDINNYTHRHVLRGSMNGNIGTALGSSPVAGFTNTQQFALTLGNDWVAEHCSVVAFIYNASTKEVVQAEEAHIIH